MALPEPNIQDLVARCLDAAETRGADAVEEICARHPGQADELRRRLDVLDRVGLLERTDPDAAFPETLGEFRLIERLGDGGMGVVFRARQAGLDRDVALKLIRPDRLMFDRARERFGREVEAVARLRHPGIVPIHSMGEENGIPFFVMEMIEGRALDDVIRDLSDRPPRSLRGTDLLQAVGGSGTVPGFEGSWVDACAHVVEQVARALAHAHEQGILHRDVKPSNILLTPHGQAVLLDFGLARAEGAATMTQAGAILGTIQYMAPEHFRGEAPDARADVYSLGVTLFELLTLRPAHEGRSTEHIRESILGGLAPVVRDANPAVTWEAETVCLVAADLDPERRYPSAAELADDLARLRDRRPIRARRPGAVLRSRRWVQRHPTLTVTMLLGFVVLISLTVLLFKQMELLARERETRQELERERDMALRALDGLLVQIGAETLDDVPQVELLRSDILDEALDLFEEMLERVPDDPRIRASAIRAYLNAAEARSELGREQVARAALNEALRLADSLLEDTPDDAPAMALAANCLVSLGDLDTNSLLHEDARRRYARAVQIRRALHDRTPDDVAAHLRLAFTRAKLAGAIESIGDTVRARELFRELLRDEEVLRRAKPDVAEALTEIYHRHGMMARKQGETELAEEYVRKALDWQKGVVETAPERGRARMNLANIHRTYAGVLLLLGRAPQDIERHRRSSVDLLEQLTVDFPKVTRYRNAYARALFAQASELHRRGRHEDAAKLYRSAIAQHDQTLAAQDGRPDYRRQRALVQVNLASILVAEGELDEAEDLLDDAISALRTLTREFPHRPRNWDGLGDACQKMSTLLIAAGEEDEAIEFLEESVAHSREVVRLLPRAPHFRSDLGAALHNLAHARPDARSFDLLFEAFREQSAAHAAQPDNPQVIRFLRNHITLIVQRLWNTKRFDETLDYVDEYREMRSEDGRAQWLACTLYAGTLQRLGPDDSALREEAIAGIVATLARGRELGHVTPERIRREGAWVGPLAKQHPEIRAALP